MRAYRLIRSPPFSSSGAALSIHWPVSRLTLALSPGEQQSRRDEVNRVLGEMGDEAIAATLASLYRLAEVDARRKARKLAHALKAPARQTILGTILRSMGLFKSRLR